MKSRPWGQRKCRDLRLSGFSLTSSRHKSVNHEGISINGRGFDGAMTGKIGASCYGAPWSSARQEQGDGRRFVRVFLSLSWFSCISEVRRHINNFVWGVQISNAARALICGRTFTVLRVRVVVLSLAATSQQGLRPHFGFSLERVVPLERNVALVVSFVPSLSPCVMAPQEPYVAVGRRLRPPSQIFHRQLPQRRDCLVSVRQNSGFVAIRNHLHQLGRCIRCFVAARCNFYGAMGFAEHGTNCSRLRCAIRWHGRSECRDDGKG